MKKCPENFDSRPITIFHKRMHKKQKIFVPRSSSPARSTLSSHFQNISPPKSPSPTPYIPSPSPSSGVFGVIAGLGAILLVICHLVLIDVYQVAISDRDLCTLDDLGTVISSYLSCEVGIPTLKSLIHRLVKFVWAIFNLALVLVGIGTLYFLGYIRLKTPESAEASADSSSASASSSASSSNSPSGDKGTVIHHPHLWLYECQHDQSAYLCFPPYCAPGGLRSLLFPSYPAIDTTGKSIERAILISDVDSTTCDNLATNSKGTSTEEDDEEEEEAEDEFAKPSKNNSPDKLHLSSNSINNPIDIFLQTAQHHHHFQLPHIIRSTLGGSKCSFKRHLLATEKKRELDSKRKESELEKEKLDSEEIETWKESSTPDSKKGRECELVPSTQYQQKEEESAAFIENTDSTEHSFWGLGAATKHLVHQAVSYSYPLLERAVDNIVHFEEILPLTSELDSPQKLDNQEQPTHQQKKTKAIPNIQSLSHVLLAEDYHYNHYTHSNISSIMPPAQQNTIPSPPSSANVPIHAQPAMNTANINDNDYTNNPAGKPIPQAVLVYHESAHSIVFRDHLRRQQSAIRRTSTQMENNSVHGHRATIAHPPQRKNVSKSPAPRHRATTMSATTSVNNTPAASRSNTPAVSRDVSTDGSDTDANDVILVSGTATTESDMGYESGGSRGSTRSNRSGGDGSSVSSVGSGVYKKNMNGVPLVKNHVNEKHHHQHKPPPPSMHPVVIANFQPVIEPLDHLDLNSSHVFEPLLDADPWAEKSEGEDMLKMTEAEREVVELLKNEQAVVKTIRNADWTSFFQKFVPTEEGGSGSHDHHPGHRPNHATLSQNIDNGHAKEESKVERPFNSFVTSTSLLPSCGKKMRCFGSTNEYATGVVFALPTAFPNDESEEDAAKRTRTWSWPSGYSAKTEFNIDNRGNLTNGREEALVPLSGLREMNHSYLYDTDYVVGGRLVKGGLTTIPYNEVYIRVGGLGRICCGVDVITGKQCNDADGTGRSFDNGIGLPVALFVREADYGHLVGLLRTRARFGAIFGRKAVNGMPLLHITPNGTRVFTEKLQQQVFKTMAWDLNPFQNPSLAYRCEIDNTSESHLKQKLEELIDLDDDAMKQVLTPEELARIAGGFGATDESVAKLLHQAMQKDILEEKDTGSSPDVSGHHLQDLVNEGLAFALRSSDYHTSRQLLILYTLVASKRSNKNSDSQPLIESDHSAQSTAGKNWRDLEKNMDKAGGNVKSKKSGNELSNLYVPPPPPPPPLDTDRLRSATNSDGLLAVLGAAQVLKAMQDGSAKRRVNESIDSIEEWIENGEQSVAFRVASWRDQRAAQGDLKIAMENDSNFMAFISNKALANRKKFAKQLRDTAAVTEFDSLQFLQTIHSILSQMNSPCLRLELLQYILGLDNRYSVAHVKRSVELAATCLNISESDVFSDEDQNVAKTNMLTA